MNELRSVGYTACQAYRTHKHNKQLQLRRQSKHDAMSENGQRTPVGSAVTDSMSAICRRRQFSDSIVGREPELTHKEPIRVL